MIVISWMFEKKGIRIKCINQMIICIKEVLCVNVRGYIQGASPNKSFHQGFSMSLKLVYPNYRIPLEYS